MTGRQILAEILATDGTEPSATATLRKRQDQAGSLATLLPIRQTLAQAAARDRWALLLPQCGLTKAQAEAVLGSPACGPLLTALGAGEVLGHPMDRVLAVLVRDRPVDSPDDPVQDLAAVLDARVTAWLDTAPPHLRDECEPDQVEDVLRPCPAAPEDPELAAALDQID